MRDENGADDRVLYVAAADPRMAHLSEIDKVPAFDQVEIRHFFEVYKASEPGKSVEASGAVSGNVRPASSSFAGAEP